MILLAELLADDRHPSRLATYDARQAGVASVMGIEVYSLS